MLAFSGDRLNSRRARHHRQRTTHGMPTTERQPQIAAIDLGRMQRGGGRRSGSRSDSGNGRGGTGTIFRFAGSRGRRCPYSRSVATGASPHARLRRQLRKLQVDERVEIGREHLASSGPPASARAARAASASRLAPISSKAAAGRSRVGSSTGSRAEHRLRDGSLLQHEPRKRERRDETARGHRAPGRPSRARAAHRR